MSGVTKSRYWWAVLYPENMRDDWQDSISEILQLPYCYCVHDADVDKKSEHRKDHVHLICAWPSPTTYKHAMNVFGMLSAEDKHALNKCEACVSVRYCYDYLIHDTEACRKAEKHRYDESDRICGNNFDIGNYEQITQEEKNDKLREMIDFVIANEIRDIATFYMAYESELEDPVVFDVFKTYGSLVERVCKGVHHRGVWQQR